MSRELLAAHPSVQDLGIQYGGINLAKTSLHRMLINEKPLHEMSDSDYAAVYHKSKKGGRTAEPKGAKVTVIKNVTNGAGVGGAANSGKLPPVSPSCATNGVPKGFSVTNTRNNTATLNNNSTNATGTASNNGSGVAPLPYTKKVVTQLPPRKNPSLVGSAFSYSADGCSDCGSFSMYSCSCCHVKAPSTVGSQATTIPSSSVASSQTKKNGRKYKIGTTYCVRSGSAQRLSAHALAAKSGRLSSLVNNEGGEHNEEGEEDLEQYENLTSVSQRMSNASVTSSQIASLKQELESERRTRLQTQIELQKIRERQKQLLDRMASKEHINMTMDDQYTIRRMLKEVNQQLAAMGVPVGDNGGLPPRGSTVGAPVEASDSVLQ